MFLYIVTIEMLQTIQENVLFEQVLDQSPV
jgi:hypothetical protein